MDEVSGILQSPNRGAASADLLIQMQEHIKMLWSQLMVSEAPVFIIGTTNSPWKIEMKEFRRRFGFVKYVGLPNDSTRQDLW